MASLPQTQLQDGMPEVTSSRNHGAGAPLTQHRNFCACKRVFFHRIGAKRAFDAPRVNLGDARDAHTAKSRTRPGNEVGDRTRAVLHCPFLFCIACPLYERFLAQAKKRGLFAEMTALAEKCRQRREAVWRELHKRLPADAAEAQVRPSMPDAWRPGRADLAVRKGDAVQKMRPYRMLWPVAFQSAPKVARPLSVSGCAVSPSITPGGAVAASAPARAASATWLPERSDAARICVPRPG